MNTILLTLVIGLLSIEFVQYLSKLVKRERRRQKYYVLENCPGIIRFAKLIAGEPYYCNAGGEIILNRVPHGSHKVSLLRKLTYAQTEYACNNCGEQSCEPVENRIYKVYSNPAFEIDLRGQFVWTRLNYDGKISKTFSYAV
jgi:hypothetical protein